MNQQQNVDAARRPSKARDPAYKRPLDLAVLVVAHVVLLPLWALLWTVIPLLIWVGDRGPVFYRQKRVGKNGQVFDVLKFRTMVVGADRMGIRVAKGDPRVTGVGRVLRRTALDELPQVLNIWKGQMSFVGPRSLPVELHEECMRIVSGFERRLQVRPGLTGLTQLKAGNTVEVGERLKYDLEYIRRMSLMYDVWLIFLSVLNTLSGRWDKRQAVAPVGAVPASDPSREDSAGPSAQADA